MPPVRHPKRSAIGPSNVSDVDSKLGHYPAPTPIPLAYGFESLGITFDGASPAVGIADPATPVTAAIGDGENATVALGQGSIPDRQIMATLTGADPGTYTATVVLTVTVL